MSDCLRIALVAEGPTDRVVLEAVLTAILDTRSFNLNLLQPEQSATFSGGFGALGSGWGGVYKWCRQAVARNEGILADDPLFWNHDLLILHLDADVADERYANANIQDAQNPNALPCAEPCPPPENTTNALRRILLSWVNQSAVPAKTVLCTPSKSTEAWVMAMLFPSDKEMEKRGWECHPNPEYRLSQQPKKQRLKKLEKSVADYERYKQSMIEQWPSVESRLSEGQRFVNEIKKYIPE